MAVGVVIGVDLGDRDRCEPFGGTEARQGRDRVIERQTGVEMRETREMRERAEPMSQPGGTAPAPGRLHVVQDIINTRDIEAGTDALDTAETLGRWLRRRELLDHGERLHDPADLDRALLLRDALRDLCVANHDDQAPPPSSVDTVEAAATTAALTIARDPNAGWRLQPQAVGVDRAWADSSRSSTTP